MSRSKKSRKPASEPRAKPKLSKEELASVEKRVRKKTGKKPGNRQQEALQNNSSAALNAQNKDPRIGSKKPIDLGGAPVKVVNKKPNKAPQQDAIAAIRYVEPAQNLAQELAAIEADEKLQMILAKQDDDVALTEQEIDYYNQLMERHQTLSDALGVDDDSEEVSRQSQKSSKKSEDDLWDKLDNASSDFSDFE